MERGLTLTRTRTVAPTPSLPLIHPPPPTHRDRPVRHRAVRHARARRRREQRRAVQPGAARGGARPGGRGVGGARGGADQPAGGFACGGVADSGLNSSRRKARASAGEQSISTLTFIIISRGVQLRLSHRVVARHEWSRH